MRLVKGVAQLACASIILSSVPYLAAAQGTVHRSGAPSTPRQTVPAVTLPSEPGLYAIIQTSMGNIVCKLFDTDAPKTVANFRGLATGTKQWKNPKTGRSMRTPLYSGTIFHRVIPDFMIQGGDPEGTGEGSPGYQFEDEIGSQHAFDKPGILAMANSGPNTNGSQFFITVAPTPWLDGKHTIFGEVVTGQDVADAISKVPRNAQDLPDTPVKLTRVLVRRVGAPAGSPAKPAGPGS
jgi:peptidyl-prolyl cis-trans isomerase A (cyclophilin A)